MAGEQEPETIAFFTNRERQFITWFYCTTDIGSTDITSMLNKHFGTSFTRPQVREVLTKIKRFIPDAPRYAVPQGDWICPRQFDIDCFEYRRPKTDLRLARSYFFGTYDQLRCCSYEGESSSSDSDELPGEFPDSYPRISIRGLGILPRTSSTPLTEVRARKLLVLLALAIGLIISLASTYYYNTIRLSIIHRWPGIWNCMTGTLLEARLFFTSLKPGFQIKPGRPYLFLQYCILFILALGKTNSSLSFLSPIKLKPLGPPSPPTITLDNPSAYKAWLSNHFPYFFPSNTTRHHRSLTFTNVLIIFKSFLQDAFHTTTLFIYFYVGWLITEINCPQLHTLQRDFMASARQLVVLCSWEGLRTVLNELVSFFCRCALPNPKLGEFVGAGVLFIACRYTCMVLFWIIGSMQTVKEKFLIGYRGE